MVHAINTHHYQPRYAHNNITSTHEHQKETRDMDSSLIIYASSIPRLCQQSVQTLETNMNTTWTL